MAYAVRNIYWAFLWARVLLHRVNTEVLTFTVVMYWQIAHLTDGAPAGYISIVWQFPQFTWATWLGAANPSFSGR